MIGEAHGWLDTGLLVLLVWRVSGLHMRVKFLEDWVFKQQEKKNHGTTF